MKQFKINFFPVLFLLFLFLFALNTFGKERLNTFSCFIENKGQIVNQNHEPNEDVLFLYNGSGITIQLRKSGFSYEIRQPNSTRAKVVGTKFPARHSDLQNTLISVYRVDIDFFAANPARTLETSGKSDDALNYFLDGKEITHVNGYQKVTYKNVFKNTDIEFVLTPNKKTPLKYNIILRPGSDLSLVKFLIKGANSLQKTALGDLQILTPLGSFEEKIPFSYYSDAPEKNTKVQFDVDNQMMGFAFEHDPSRTFIIDPSSNLIWGTYYGGAGIDYCNATGVDAQNNVFICGYTSSNSNMATNGAYQNTLNGSFDAYLAKFNANGQRLWATYFGGSGVDVAYAMYVEPTGSIYICGDSFSTSNVASPGAYQTVYGGGIDDAILAKFNSSGQRLWSTYYGGTQHDIAQAITVDKAGNPIITGHTESTNGIATAGSYNTTYVFNYDVFVAKFTSNGALLWGTYYGDAATDEAYGIACDTLNFIYVTGGTASGSGISSPLSHQITIGGGQDAFIAKFNPGGNNLVWGTYYGGSGNDFGTAIKVSPAGFIFIGGTTTSGNNISSPNAYQINPGSVDDAFLLCFNLSGQRVWGTYFGGNDTDYINDLVLDPKSNILFCGSTLSTNSISTSGAYQSGISAVNTYDAYFAKYTITGQKKLASYYGGPANETTKGIAVDNSGKIYLAGETTSTIGISTPASHQPTMSSSPDAFLTKFCITYEPLISPSGSSTLCAGSVTLTMPSGFANYIWSNAGTSNPLVVNSTTLPGTYYFSCHLYDGFGCEGLSDTARIVIKTCTYTAVQEQEGNTKLTIYPSPTTDQLHVEIKGKLHNEAIQVTIYSSTGQLIRSELRLERELDFDLHDLANGLYVLRIKNENYDLCGKFIKN